MRRLASKIDPPRITLNAKPLHLTREDAKALTKALHDLKRGDWRHGDRGGMSWAENKRGDGPRQSAPVIRVSNDSMAGYNTRVEIDGQLMPNVRRLAWQADAHGVAICTLEMYGVQIDAIAEVAENSTLIHDLMAHVRYNANETTPIYDALLARACGMTYLAAAPHKAGGTICADPKCKTQATTAQTTRCPDGANCQQARTEAEARYANVDWTIATPGATDITHRIEQRQGQADAHRTEAAKTNTQLPGIVAVLDTEITDLQDELTTAVANYQTQWRALMNHDEHEHAATVCDKHANVT